MNVIKYCINWISARYKWNKFLNQNHYLLLWLIDARIANNLSSTWLVRLASIPPLFWINLYKTSVTRMWEGDRHTRRRLFVPPSGAAFSNELRLLPRETRYLLADVTASLLKWSYNNGFTICVYVCYGGRSCGR